MHLEIDSPVFLISIKSTLEFSISTWRRIHLKYMVLSQMDTRCTLPKVASFGRPNARGSICTSSGFGLRQVYNHDKRPGSGRQLDGFFMCS